MTLDMKRVLYIVFVTITFAFWGCDSNTPHSSNKVVTGVASEVTSCSAVLSATLKIDESQYRNIGVGRALISSFVEFCKANKIVNCFLWPDGETAERI